MSENINKERMKLAVDALRSGEYPQEYRALRSESGYCCLGVMCEVARKNGLDVKMEENLPYYTYDEAIAFLPQSVAEWYGFFGFNTSPYVTVEGYENRFDGDDKVSLVTLNDTGVPFHFIADVLSRNFLDEV